MDLKFYLSVLARRWWIVVFITALVTGYTYHKSSKEPTVYSATARLLYEENNIAQSVMGSSGMFMPIGWNNPVDTQLQLIKTRPNVEAVIKHLGLDDPSKGHVYTPDELLPALGAEVDKNTNIIVLHYTSLNPAHATEIVNELGKVFCERNRSFHQQSATETRHFIEAQLAKTEQMLNEAEADVRHFREVNQIFQVGSLGDTAAAHLAGIDTTLTDGIVNRKVAEFRLADAKRHLTVTDPSVGERIERLHADPVLVQLESALAQQEAGLTVKKTDYQAESPEVKDAQARLDKLRAAVQVRVKHVLGRGLDTQDANAIQTPSEQRYMTLMIEAETELAIQTARENALKGTRDIYEARFMTLPAKDQALARLMRRKNAAEETYNLFLKRAQEIRITEAMNGANVRLVEPASSVGQSRNPFDKAVALAALMGLIFGLGIALLIEFLDDRIRRPEEAQNVLELPILGLLPWVDGQKNDRQRLVVLDDPRSPVTESYRALQTYTRLVEPDQPMQCQLLTSPGPKEGKSTVLANLAVTSAQLGKRTLIVDTDLRAPTQHIHFDRPNLTGIYDVVYEGLPLREAIQETAIDNLDILTTGPVPPDPVNTLHAESFKRMLESLKKDYDAIFFDSPPINMFTDAAVLGRQMDSVLLVVDVRSTTRQSTLTAKELLTKAKVPLAGMVVKNSSLQTSRYHNRYYERYYMDRLKHMADD